MLSVNMLNGQPIIVYNSHKIKSNMKGDFVSAVGLCSDTNQI